MNIEIKYQAEDGEILYYHFESWELAEDDAFREAMQEFRSTRTGKNKSSPSGMHRLVQAATGKNNPPDDGRWYRPKPFSWHHEDGRGNQHRKPRKGRFT